MTLTGVRRERAIELSRALLRLASRNPYLVRQVVMGYCHSVSVRMRVVLTDDADADFGRKLLKLVKELNLPQLSARIIGFSVGDEQANLTTWLQLLGLSSSTDIKSEPAHNSDNSAALRHVGIKLVCGKSKRASREFHEVMMVAAVIELWKCVTTSIP